MTTWPRRTSRRSSGATSPAEVSVDGGADGAADRAAQAAGPQRSAGLAAGVAALARSPAARRLVAVRLTGQGADGLLQAALASLVLLSPERAATARGIAEATVVLVLPFTVVGPWAGGVLDRFRRRQVLLVCALVRAGLALGCAAAVIAAPQVVVAVLALAYLSVNRLLLAALSAALPRVVPALDLVAANAVVPTAGSAAALAGGALGLALRAALPPRLVDADAADALVLVAAGLLAGAAALPSLRLASDRLGPDAAERRALAARPSPGGQLAAALRHVVQRRSAGAALVLVGLHRFGYGVVLVASLLIARNHLHLPLGRAAGLVGTILAVSGGGFAAAAALTPSAVRRWGRRRWAAACCLLAALCPLAVIAWPVAAAIVAAAALLGLAAQGVKVVVDTTVQLAVDDAFRGRVFVLYDVVFNVALLAAVALAALVVPDDGYSVPVLGAAVGLWGALGALLLVPRRGAPARGRARGRARARQRVVR